MRRAGLLGERWMRKPSNGPSAARQALERIAREAERPKQDAKGRVAWRALDAQA